MEYLFTYGTLKNEQVQHYIFHRTLEGQSDSLPGFKRLENVVYDRYPLVINTDNPNDTVEGVAYKVSLDELMQADVYETKAYKRIKMSLKSGISAWVYVENSN
ncbi:gamma-glutamylcyclotransferase family protein [uncultured Allomuricauda sp.]|uniref:gamma-glutamylcyclotransferase family protein n=1 Tax=Flagellimonas sp. W118 TaxID=3410791 RepID=UPI00261E5578|nr:gamma-glutamylcyclotransferase family protein [uncultured Allomuricauda sp.]